MGIQKKLYKFLLMMGGLYCLHLLFIHDLLNNISNDYFNTTDSHNFNLSYIICLYTYGVIIILINTVLTIAVFYKVFKRRQSINAEYGSSFIESHFFPILLTGINTIIFYKIKLDYTAFGFYFAFVFIAAMYILFLVILITFIKEFLSKVKSTKFSDYLFGYLFFCSVTMMPFIMAGAQYSLIRRNINNFDLRSDWYNFNFEAIYDNVIIYYDDEKIDGVHKVKIISFEPFEYRSDLFYNPEKENIVVIDEIYFANGQKIVNPNEDEDYESWMWEFTFTEFTKPKEIKKSVMNLCYFKQEIEFKEVTF